MAPYQIALHVSQQPFSRFVAIEYHASLIEHQRGNIVIGRSRFRGHLLKWEHLTAFFYAKQTHQNMLIKP